MLSVWIVAFVVFFGSCIGNCLIQCFLYEEDEEGQTSVISQTKQNQDLEANEVKKHETIVEDYKQEVARQIRYKNEFLQELRDSQKTVNGLEMSNKLMVVNLNTLRQEIVRLRQNKTLMVPLNKDGLNQDCSLATPCKCCRSTEVYTAPLPMICHSVLDKLRNPFETIDCQCSHDHNMESNIVKLFELVINVKQTIDLCMFDLHNNQLCYEMLETLKQSKIRIRIVVDHKKLLENLSYSDHSDKIRNHLIELVKRPDIQVRSIDKVKGFMHNKFAIFDSKHLTAGSMNWTHGIPCNNETFEITQQVKRIVAYQKIFNELFITAVPFYFCLYRFDRIKITLLEQHEGVEVLPGAPKKKYRNRKKAKQVCNQANNRKR